MIYQQICKNRKSLFADDTNILCGGKDMETNIKDSITDAISWFNEKQPLR